MEFENIIAKLKEILIQYKWTIATAESLTAGLMSSYLASISGSSGYLKGGVAAYTIPIKAEILGVDQQMAERCNAYSSEVAKQMVQGVCSLYNTNIGVSTTGYAEPSPEHKIEMPQAFVAISIDGEIKIKQVFAQNLSRNQARNYIAEQALTFLLDELEKQLIK